MLKNCRCPCGTEFCYLCGLVWRTCDCPLYLNYELRVPLARRPGARPDRFNRVPRNRQSGEVLRIPQLRAIPEEYVEAFPWPTLGRTLRRREPRRAARSLSPPREVPLQPREQRNRAVTDERRLAPPGMEQYYEGIATPVPSEVSNQPLDEHQARAYADARRRQDLREQYLIQSLVQQDADQRALEREAQASIQREIARRNEVDIPAPAPRRRLYPSLEDIRFEINREEIENSRQGSQGETIYYMREEDGALRPMYVRNRRE